MQNVFFVTYLQAQPVKYKKITYGVYNTLTGLIGLQLKKDIIKYLDIRFAFLSWS